MMNRILNYLAAVLITILLTPLALTTGCGDDNVNVVQSPGTVPVASLSPSPSPSPAPTQVTVNLTQIFSPTTIFVQQNIVQKIATIVIVNNVTENHWIIADNGKFNTGIIAPGEDATVIIDEPGDYTYHCGVHPNETGTLHVDPPPVQPSPTSTATSTPTPTLTPTPTTSPTPTISPTQSPTVTPSPLQSPQNTIIITADASNRTNDAFASGPISVSQNSTVTVINNDTVAHTATADNGTFDTGVIQPGESATFVADQAGDIPFHCTLHPNMRGVLRVAPDATLPTPTPLVTSDEGEDEDD